ncbi:hypothetical protein Patl1_34156 [Pistacia atlantica]|uniref:Uncharacterized protein n=1 Tax=Pistacia atlantica TaxID=434234 RepID=A0ACC0ZPA9_9ROSI|nr:hypothetical protein Patl1_34156 [Pistacia atlantica]
MDTIQVKSLLILCLVLGVLAGQSVANFTKCYHFCLIGCMFSIITGPTDCAGSCKKECLRESGGGAFLNSNDFCNVGCVSSMCSSLMTKENLPKPGGKKLNSEYFHEKEKVEKCLDSCTTRPLRQELIPLCIRSA